MQSTKAIRKVPSQQPKVGSWQLAYDGCACPAAIPPLAPTSVKYSGGRRRQRPMPSCRDRSADVESGQFLETVRSFRREPQCRYTGKTIVVLLPDTAERYLGTYDL